MPHGSWGASQLSRIRLIWNVAHIGLGRSVLVLAFANLVLGITLINKLQAKYS